MCVCVWGGGVTSFAMGVIEVEEGVGVDINATCLKLKYYGPSL